MFIVPEHLLLCCPAYDQTRDKLLALSQALPNQVSQSLVTNTLLTYSNSKIMQLLLDCSVLPEVILCAQRHGDHVYNDLFFIGRIITLIKLKLFSPSKISSK